MHLSNLRSSLFLINPKPDYFNQKNNKLLPKLAKENYKDFLESLLTKTRLSIQPKIDGCAIAIRYINGNFKNSSANYFLKSSISLLSKYVWLKYLI